MNEISRTDAKELASAAIVHLEKELKLSPPPGFQALLEHNVLCR